MVDSPSGGVPTKAQRWDLADTEGYGSGNYVSGAPWMFLGYIGIYRRKKYVGGRSRGPGDRGAPRRCGRALCSGPTRMDQVSVLMCHSWISMLTHTVLEGFITEVNHMYKVM